MRVYPLSQNEDGRKTWDCEAISANHVFPAGASAEMIAADPDVARPQWVVPGRFWQDLATMLDNNPTVGPGDAAMAEQARALVALHTSDPAWAALLDKAALEADADLCASARYEQVGVPIGNGWQRQKNAGSWGTDWFGRAQQAVIYILTNDWREAVYLIRGTDADGRLLDGPHRYTMTFAGDALPPVDRARGGFWSLTMYDDEYFMLPDAPDGRTNLGDGQPRRRPARLRRRRLADADARARRAGRSGGAGQLTAGAEGAVRADGARLCAGGADPR
jgi:hypothetical protein